MDGACASWVALRINHVIIIIIIIDSLHHGTGKERF
jgi:hypothetical protein